MKKWKKYLSLLLALHFWAGGSAFTGNLISPRVTLAAESSAVELADPKSMATEAESTQGDLEAAEAGTVTNCTNGESKTEYIVTNDMTLCTGTQGEYRLTYKKARPKVSVIIPVYNVEPYLRECLDSVINQTLPDIEIICVNDGSTDKSGDILNEYAQKDKRIIVIHQKNMGSALARQSAMDIARGEYIKYVDSDDYIDLRTLEICYNEAKKDDVDILVHGAYAFNQDKQWVLSQLPYRLFTEQQFNWSNIVPYPAVWLRFYKTEFLKNNNFSYNGISNMSEDQCFNLICTPSAKKIKSIPNLLSYYRKHSSSLCATVAKSAKARDHCSNLCVAYENFKRRGYFFNDKAYISFLRNALQLNFWPNDTQICKMFYDTLNKLDPTLLTDKKIISQLTRDEQDKLKKIIAAARPDAAKYQDKKPASTRQFKLRRLSQRR